MAQFVPVFFPVLVGMGIDPVLFGIIAIILMGAAGLTPPFGITIYAISGVAKDVPLFRIFRGAAPFLIAMMILECIVIFSPQVALFLPSTMFQ